MAKTSNQKAHGNVLKRNWGLWQSMSKGYFNYRGELFFDIELKATDSSIVIVNALLDTGVTVG